MRKRTMWLAQGTGGDSVLFRTRPKKVVSKATQCECGNSGCYYNEPASVTYEGESVDEFCADGLEDAGIVLRPGELVKVTLESVR